MPQLPPAALLGNFDWESRQTRLLPPPTMADQDQLINVGNPNQSTHVMLDFIGHANIVA